MREKKESFAQRAQINAPSTTTANTSHEGWGHCVLLIDRVEEFSDEGMVYVRNDPSTSTEEKDRSSLRIWRSCIWDALSEEKEPSGDKGKSASSPSWMEEEHLWKDLEQSYLQFWSTKSSSLEHSHRTTSVIIFLMRGRGEARRWRDEVQVR